MKNTKRCFVLFSFYDRTGIETFLEKQAENGWMLDKTSALGWHFHRMEPKKLHFSVVYFAKASAFDPEPSEQQLAFQDFCEHTGWRLAANNAQMQIFYNEADDPTPIETDAAIEVAAIHAAAKKTYLSNYYLLTGVGILQAALFFWRLSLDPIGVLASNANLFSGLCWMLVLALAVVEITGYWSWHKKAKAAAQLDGSFIETKGHRNFQIIILCMMCFAFSFLLIAYGGSRMSFIALATVAIVLGITAIIVGVSEGMKKLKMSAKCNRNITVVLTLVLSFGFTGILLIGVVNQITKFLPEKIPVETYEYKGWTQKIYADELPLTIEDLIETDYTDYSYEMRTVDKSIFLEQKEAVQRPRMDALEQPELEYSITEVKVPFLYNWCKNALLENFAHNYGRPEPEDEMWEEHIAIDAKPWGAKEAYQLKLGGELEMRFLLCYEKCIIEIDFEHDWKLTQEQMAIVCQKLNKN